MKRITAKRIWIATGVVIVVLVLLFRVSRENKRPTFVSPVSPLTNQTPIGEPTSFLDEGDQLLRFRRYEQAITVYDQAIESSDDLARAYAGRGHAYVGLRRFGKAVSDYTTSLEYNRMPVVLASRCNAYRMLAKFTLAMDDCNEAIELDPNNAETHVALTMLFLEQGNTNQARAEINTARQLDPEYVNAQYVLAQVESAEGHLAAAAIALSKCIEMDQSQPAYYWERGFIYYSLGKIDQAKEDMRSVLRYGVPEVDGELLFNAGKMLRSLGESP